MKNYLSAFACICCLFATSSAFGQNNFNVLAGDWHDAASWDMGVPSTGGSAFINNGGTASLSLDTNTILDLGVGQGAGTSGVLNHSMGTLDSNNGWIRFGDGAGSNGVVNMSGSAILNADHTNSGGGDQRIFVGTGDGSNGTLDMRDQSRVITTGQVRVADGANATGAVSISGESNVTSTNQFALATGPGSNGTLNMSGEASINSGGLDVGQGGSTTALINVSDDAKITAGSINLGSTDSMVTVNQTGGMVTSSSWIGIANNGGGTVNYNISNGQLISNGDFFSVGEDGVGNLNISGTSDVQANGIAMAVGRNGGGNGLVEITGSEASVFVMDLQVANDAANSGTLSWIADATGVSVIESLDNTEFGPGTSNLMLDLTMLSYFGDIGTVGVGTATEILLIDNGALVSGTFTGIADFADVSIGGGKFGTLNYFLGADNFDVTVTVWSVAIPEPSSLVILTAIGLAMTTRRRKS